MGNSGYTVYSLHRPPPLSLQYLILRMRPVCLWRRARPNEPNGRRSTHDGPDQCCQIGPDFPFNLATLAAVRYSIVYVYTIPCVVCSKSVPVLKQLLRLKGCLRLVLRTPDVLADPPCIHRKGLTCVSQKSVCQSVEATQPQGL